MNELSGAIQILPIQAYTLRGRNTPKTAFTFADAMSGGIPSLIECEVDDQEPQAVGKEVLEVMQYCDYGTSKDATLEVFESTLNPENLFAVLRGVTHVKYRKHGLFKLPLGKILRPLYKMEAIGIYPEVNLAFGRAARQLGQNALRQWIYGSTTKETEVITEFSPWLTRAYSGKIEATE